MPALPIIANVYRVTLNWAGPGGTRAANVLHFLAAGSTSAAVAADIDAAVTATMWNHAGANTAVQTVDVLALDGVSPAYSLGVAGAKWAGPSASGDVMPAGAAIVTLRTATRGRQARGRVFLPFVQESNQSNGVITPAVAAAMQTAWTTFLTAVVAQGSTLVVATYGGVNHTQWTPVARTVTSITAQSIMGTTRLRQSRLR